MQKDQAGKDPKNGGGESAKTVTASLPGVLGVLGA